MKHWPQAGLGSAGQPWGHQIWEGQAYSCSHTCKCQHSGGSPDSLRAGTVSCMVLTCIRNDLSYPPFMWTFLAQMPVQILYLLSDGLSTFVVDL